MTYTNFLHFYEKFIELQKDFHWEYTECDSDGGRWKVQVPEANVCVGGAPLPPVRGKSCGM